MHNQGKGILRRCGITGLVILKTELDAKIVLAERVWKDKGERRHFKCRYYNHYHLTQIDHKADEGVELTLSR